MAATGLKVGADWAVATKTIVDGTGATGAPLKQLQTDFQAVAKHGAPAATAIADLNTHLGLAGPELVKVADAALKMGVNTSSLGTVLAQTGGGLEGYLQTMGDLLVASQATDVSQEQLLDTVSKNSARWQAGGGDINDLLAHVTALAQEFGPTGLRGAMSETMAEVDTGVIPTVTSLREQFGDTSTAIEDTYGAAYTWRDALVQTKDAAIAYLGPAGDMLAGVGAMAVGLVQIIPLLAGTKLGIAAIAAGQAVWNAVMNLNPIMLIVTAIVLAGAAIWTWRDQIMGFLSGAWNAFVGAIEAGINILRPLAKFVGVDLPEDLGSWKIAQEEATAAVESAGPAVEVLAAETVELETAMVATVPAVAAAKVEIEAFDLSTVSLTNQLQQVKPAIKDIGDMLEASGVQAGAAVLPWGFFADETSVKVPDAMGIVMDSIMEVPPTAEEVSRQLGQVAPTWGQNMMDGLKSTFSPAGVGATFARAFEGGGGAMGAFKSLAAQGGSQIMDGISTALSASGPWGQAAAVGLQFATAMGKKIWSGLKGMFGGPSEAVVAARENMGAYAATIDADTLNQERLADWIAGGFSPDHAKIVTGLQDLAMSVGESSQAGVDLWLDYQRAVEDGNQAAIDAVMAQIAAWEASGAAAVTAAEEGAAAQVAAAAETARIAEEIAGIEAQRAAKHLEFEISALEEAKTAKIGELKASMEAAMEMLEAEETAKMDALRATRDAEMELLSSARDAKLESLKATQDAALDAMRTARDTELAEIKAGYDAEMAALKSARAAELGEVESAIQRELESTRIGTQLEFDLNRAGEDAELIAAAQARAAKAAAKLADQREVGSHARGCRGTGQGEARRPDRGNRGELHPTGRLARAVVRRGHGRDRGPLGDGDGRRAGLLRGAGCRVDVPLRRKDCSGA